LPELAGVYEDDARWNYPDRERLLLDQRGQLIAELTRLQATEQAYRDLMVRVAQLAINAVTWEALGPERHLVAHRINDLLLDENAHLREAQ